MQLRLTDLYAPLMRPTEIRTRHSGLFRFYDWAVASDVCYFDITSGVPESVGAVDVRHFFMQIRNPDFVLPQDLIAVAIGGRWADSTDVLDVIHCNFTVTFQDSVVTSSNVGLSVGPNSSSNEAVASYDKTLFHFGSGVGSVGLAADAVVLGMRYLIDCFYGGISFSGCPFGGRIL